MEKEHISLWRKIQTYYHYHWMNRDLLFYKPVARPLWFMTHTKEQIDRRTTAYLDRVHREDEKIMKQLLACLEFFQNQDDSQSPSS